MPEGHQTALGSAIREAQEWRALFEVMKWMFQDLMADALIFQQLGVGRLAEEDLRDAAMKLFFSRKGMIEAVERSSQVILIDRDIDFKRRIIARLESALRQEAHFAAESGDADA